MPLTSGNVTIKLSAGNYSSWAAFWNDLGNLTGDITCTVDASAFSEGAAPSPPTEDLGGYTLKVTAATFATTTDASTGPRFTINHDFVMLDIQMEGAGAIIIEGMVFIKGSGTAPYVIYTSAILTAFDLTIRRNIFKEVNRAIYDNEATVVNFHVYNNIIYDCFNTGIRITTDKPNAILANNTVVNTTNQGINAGDELVTFENNLSYGNGNDFIYIGGLTIGNNNADSDNTGEDADWGGGGANNVSNIADPFNDLANDDFTITAEGVIGTAGLDLSGDFTDDFFGTTRINWTIGACEYVLLPLEVSVSECVDTEEHLA